MFWRCVETRKRNEVHVVATILRVAAKGSKEDEIMDRDEYSDYLFFLKFDSQSTVLQAPTMNAASDPSHRTSHS